MRIEKTSNGGVDVLAISGEFDCRTAGRFDREIESLVERFHKRIVLDLSRVDFMDSAALTRLIHTQRRLRPLEGEMVIAGPAPAIQSTIKTAGVDRLIRVFPDVDEGRRYFVDPAAARASDLAGVPLDETKLGRVEIEFGLLGEEASASTAKLLTTYEDGLLIRYPIDDRSAKIDPAALAAGRSLWVRFRQPILDPDRVFELETEVEFALDDPEGGPNASKYRLRFTKIDEADRARMRELAEALDAYRSHGRPPESV